MTTARDAFPELSEPAAIKARSRGVPLRDNGRAVAVAFVSDGALLPQETLVRFEVAVNEDPARRLGEAFSATGARALWFYGGDSASWRAATGLDLQMAPWGVVMTRGADGPSNPDVALRRPQPRDRISLADLHDEHVPFFRAPDTQLAEIRGDIVGAVFSEALDTHWTEVRVLVYPALRGRGYSSLIVSEAASRLAKAGRGVCTLVPIANVRARAALETAGFRVADYFFIARRSKNG